MVQLLSDDSGYCGAACGLCHGDNNALFDVVHEEQRMAHRFFKTSFDPTIRL